MPSPIRAIRLRPYTLVLAAPWRTAHGAENTRQGIVVELETPDGTGVGDCAPLPSHGTETLEEADTFFRRLGSKFDGGPVQMLLARLHPLRVKNPAACYALETACLDLLAQENGKSLRTYLGPRSPDTVAVNTVIGTLDGRVTERAHHAVEEGFDILKVKAGRAPGDDELAALGDLCAALPEGARLRVDVNGAWGYEEATRVIEGLAGHPIESIEEPCAEADLEDLAGLQARAPFPLALDDTLSRRGLDDVIAAKPVKRLILKPTVVGSLAVAAKVGREALREGFEVVATTALDSAIGVTAAAQLAAVFDGFDPETPSPAHGLATARWFERDLAPSPPIERGRMTLPDEPGLGVSFSPSP